MGLLSKLSDLVGIPLILDFRPPYEPTEEEQAVMQRYVDRAPLTDPEREHASAVIDRLADHGWAPGRDADGTLFWTTFSDERELSPPRRR